MEEPLEPLRSSRNGSMRPRLTHSPHPGHDSPRAARCSIMRIIRAMRSLVKAGGGRAERHAPQGLLRSLVTGFLATHCRGPTGRFVAYRIG